MEEQARVAGPDLFEEEAVHDPAGMDEVAQGEALARRQAVERRGDIDRSEAADTGVERRVHGLCVELIEPALTSRNKMGAMQLHHSPGITGRTEYPQIGRIEKISTDRETSSGT